MPDPKIRVVTEASAAPASGDKKAGKTERAAVKSNDRDKKAEAVKPAKNVNGMNDKGEAARGKALSVAASKTPAPTETKSKPEKGGGKAAALDPKKKKLIFIIAAAAVLVVALVIVLATCIKCNSNSPADILPFDPDFSTGGDPDEPSFDPIDPNDGLPTEVYTSDYINKTKVGYRAEYLGTVERDIPAETHDEGLETGYPKFGYTLDLTTEQKNAMIAENNLLCAKPTANASGTYDKMDKDGNLYLEGTPLGRKLYKHTGAVGLWLGDVSDDEPALVKRFTMEPRGYSGYAVTGLYAPAGEVIKLEMSEDDMNKTGGLTFHIGQALFNGQANNIWSARNFNRMPVILNTMNFNKSTAEYSETAKTYTCYIGSFVGGPIYIRNVGARFTVTISGGVAYSHFIYGYTTPEEFAQNFKSSAPYFDLEVWDLGVLHSGPRRYADPFSYDDLYKAAVLWEKISLVSTQISRQGIVFLYDAFVAAGAAVAFPGRRSVNCPMDWMVGSLNYNSLVNSGSWGNLHEYNHNFQGWGLPGGGEVTNNAVTLVEYSLFTRISAARKLGMGGDGMGGWNRYTSASWAAQQVCGSRENDLSIYSTLLHAFGQDSFIKTCASHAGGVDGYFNKFAENTHNNMTYFAALVGKEMSAEAIAAMNDKGYSMFVPVASIYQTGRSYMYDGEKRYGKTMQPYQIAYGKPFDIDLRPFTVENGMYQYGSVVLPSDFTFTVKSVTRPEYGTIVDNGNGVFTYTPDGEHMSSGKIRVTLGITKNNGSFKVDDVDLVIELAQSHEMNKSMLERVTYTYAEGASPETAKAAFESGFADALSKTVADNVNPVQNGNTEIWSRELLPDDTFYEIRGKFYISETSKYRIALRGRWDCALFVSVNSDKDGDYRLAAEVQTTQNHANFYNDEKTYCDIEDLKAGDWLYFRAVLKSTHKGGTNAYIGLGWGKFTPAHGTVDEDGNFSGTTEETVRVEYANAYRTSYEFTDTSFTSDYFITRTYSYNYSDTVEISDGLTVIAEGSNYRPWTDNVEQGHYDISHLFDGKPDTYIHTARDQSVNANSPLVLACDAGKTIIANRFNVYGWTEKNMTNIGFPTAFTLELRATKDGEPIVKQFTGVNRNGKNATVDLGESIEFRYFTIKVTASDNGRCALTALSFSNATEYLNGTIVGCDADSIRYRGEWSTESALSTFGHIYVGKNDAVCEFKFNGNRFALFALRAARFGTVEIYVDDEKIGATSLSGNGDGADLVFLSDKLSDGEHLVSVRSTGGTINIDSFVYWK